MSFARRPPAVIVSGPSGVGKTTLINKLRAEFPDVFGFSVSHTTRGRRAHEADGVDYHFVDREEFLRLKKEGAFLETTEYNDNLYGTSADAVGAVIRVQRKVCLIDINLDSVLEICKCPFHMSPLRIFLEPPSVDELERRLKGRGEKGDDLMERLKKGREELKWLEEGGASRFDHVLLNDELEQSYSNLKALLEREGVFPAGSLLLTPAPSP